MSSKIKKGLRIAGVFLFSFGLMLLFNPTFMATGYAISEGNTSSPFTIFGITAIIIGLMTFVVGIEKRKKNIQELIYESIREQPLPD